MKTLAIRGVYGLVMWHHYRCAAIYRYAVTRVTEAPNAGYSVTATIVRSDPFKMSRTPLRFIALLKGVRWEWPILAHTFDPPSGRFAAQLGEPLCIKEDPSVAPHTHA